MPQNIASARPQLCSGAILAVSAFKVLESHFVAQLRTFNRSWCLAFRAVQFVGGDLPAGWCGSSAGVSMPTQGLVSKTCRVSSLRCVRLKGRVDAGSHSPEWRQLLPPPSGSSDGTRLTKGELGRLAKEPEPRSRKRGTRRCALRSKRPY